ncbi:Isochorismatase family protein [Salmonella enterica subsp. arizonae]|uniref:Isochorismatase family protein n=1 Tax=Salmonella enterica subsp. arizonae TaxID=59203 RepID=A0A3S4HGV9_SALER|nr:Isochorismatase family protein [Salmonella enterica subsp. arizonae]
MAFPAISAVAEGYKVFAVDRTASGTIQQDGARRSPWHVSCRLASYRWIPPRSPLSCKAPGNREDAAAWADVYTQVFPAYQLLIESYSKAQDVVKNNEMLDSQR